MLIVEISNIFYTYIICNRLYSVIYLQCIHCKREECVCLDKCRGIKYFNISTLKCEDENVCVYRTSICPRFRKKQMSFREWDQMQQIRQLKISIPKKHKPIILE